jgi:WD40 repeat protein
VKLRRDRIVVVLNYKVYVYNFSDLKLLDTIDTLNNERALVSLSPKVENIVLAIPGTQVGHVRVELYDIKKTTHIAAHETALACIALSFDGTRLATASEKGTLIRVFDTKTGKLLHELRRGAERADIYSISFHPSNQWIVVSSDKGTVHVFKLEESEREKNSNNPTSSLSFFSSLLPKYFSSQWSFAQFKVPEVRNIVAFGPDKFSLVCVCADGTFYKAVFDPEKPGQECSQESFVEFMRKPDESA